MHLVLNLDSKQNSLLGFFYSKLFVIQIQKCQNLSEALPPETHQGFNTNPSRTSITAPRDPHLHFTAFQNSICVKKRTLVKLLGQMPIYLP